MDIKDLPIGDKIISIFASGESIRDLTDSDLDRLNRETFSIGINLFDLFVPTVRVWCDESLTRYWQEHYKNQGLDCLLLTREQAFHPQKDYPIRDKVEYWFDHRKESLRDGNWTFWYIIQLLKRYFPKNKILLFGVDCWSNRSVKIDEDLHTYVVYTNDQQKHVDKLIKAFEAMKNDHPWWFENLYNCNLNSNLKCVELIKYEEVLDGRR